MLSSEALKSWKPVEWPDLSCQRVHAASSLTTTDQSLEQNNAPEDPRALVLLGLAVIVAAYCGTPDVLLAVSETIQDKAFHLVRVVLQHDASYAGILLDINKNLLQNAEERPITMHHVRAELQVASSHAFALPLCVFSTDSAAVVDGHPFTISFNTKTLHFSTAALSTFLHPSVLSVLQSQLGRIIEHILAHPESSHATLPALEPRLMSVREQTDEEDLAAAYSHTPRVQFVTEYIAQWAERTPDAIAVSWYPELSVDHNGPVEQLTFHELYQKSNMFARWLVNEGLQDGDRVAVCMNRNPMFHVAMLGILQAGACYVPIDPELPAERKTFIASDSNARFTLTTSEFSSSDEFGPGTVLLDDKPTLAGINAQSGNAINVANAEALAYLLYTSGTTGTPKGCLLTHKGLSKAIPALAHMAASVRMEDLTKGKYLTVASIAFDVHIAEIFVPLALGMAVFSAPRALLLEDLPFYIKTLEITHVGIVPSLIEATMGAVQEEEDDNAGMALRYIASGGEKMSDSILDKWADHPKVRLANFYGPSEATIGCCSRFMDRTTPRANIGRSFESVASYVVNEDMGIVLRGGLGELVIEGPLVGQGYHGRPDLTEKVFLEWPEKGKWSYRTGDLVRMMPDDTFEIVGRIDSQIKLRGVRIEAEGISSIIRSASVLPLDAVTILAKHPSISGGTTEQLVSFISWDTSVSVSTRKSNVKPVIASPPSGLLKGIRQDCQTQLPSYMRPSHIIPLNFLPLNPTGKLDAKVLREIFESLDIKALFALPEGDSQHDETASRSLTAVEEKVLDVLEKHVTVSRNPKANLFEMGMDSMAVIRFAVDLKTETGQALTASDIMKSPTVEAIASAIERCSSQQTVPSAESSVTAFAIKYRGEIIRAYNLKDEDVVVLPPFSVQEGVLYRSADSPKMYVQHVVFQCAQDVSLERLRSAWSTVMNTRSILRTIFYIERFLAQVVLPSASCVLPWTEQVASFNDDASFSRWFFSSDAESLADSINQDISTRPPFRLNAYTSHDRHFFVLSIHHSLFDGISLPTIIKDVEQAYFGSPLRSVLSAVDILDEISDATNMQRTREFWADCFAGFIWPADQPLQSDSVENTRLVVPFSASLSSLKVLATSQKVTLQALLTCTFANLVACKLYRQADVSFGTIRSGRLLSSPDIDSAPYPVLSVLPVRVTFKGRETLQNVQTHIAEAVEFEHIPLGKIQNFVRPGGSLFGTLFSVSHKTSDVNSSIWNVLDSELSQPDYVLAVEVVLDEETDSLYVQGVFTSHPAIAKVILNSFEAWSLIIGASGMPVSAEEMASPDSDSTMPSDKVVDAVVIDPALLEILSTTVCKFLQVDAEHLKNDASFLAFGLDSISSVGLARRFRAEGLRVSAIDIINYHTLTQLGSLLTTRKNADADTQPIQQLVAKELNVDSLSWKLSPDDNVEVYHATDLQAGMLSQTLSSRGSLYVHAFPLQLVAGLDLNRLKHAWAQAVEKLSILRTSFHFIAETGIWIQAVHSDAPIDWSVVECQSMEQNNILQKEFISSITLAEEEDFFRPPFCVRLFTGTASDQLVVIMHHALYDGLSVEKLFKLVKNIYAGKIETLVQFKDLLGHFRSQESSGISFFAEQLRGYNMISLPRLQNGPSTTHTINQAINFSDGVVNTSCRKPAVTMQCLGQLAWSKLMATLASNADVVIGHVVSGRTAPNAEECIGPILNTLPLRIQLRNDVTNFACLQEIHRSNVAALPWQSVSLRGIQKQLGVSSLFQGLFLFQPLASPQDEDDTEPLWHFIGDSEDDEAKIQYPINLELHQTATGFLAKLACKSEFMDAFQLTNAANRFHEILRAIVNSPQSLVLSDIPEAVQNSPSVSDEQATRTVEPNEGGQGQITSSLKDIIASVANLPSDDVSLDTRLASLGIDSITAIQIVSKCRTKGIRISASDIIESDTVGDIIAKISSQTSKPATTSQLSGKIHAEPDEEKAILLQFGSNQVESITIASAGMRWLLGAWQRSEGTRYQHVFAYDVAGKVDIARLRQSWLMLIAHHPILRSTFTLEDPPHLVTFKVSHDFDYTWTEEYIEDDDYFFQLLLARMKELIGNLPSISRPPSRALLFRSKQRRYLVLHLHHFQYDGWSLPLLVHDLAQCYLGKGPSNSNNDLHSFLRLFAPTADNIAKQRQYWQSISHVPDFFPVIQNDKAVKSNKRMIYFQKAVTNLASLEQRARTLHMSLQSVFLACWAKTQAHYTESASATFGLWQAGRGGSTESVLVDKLAVPCMNVLPLCVLDCGQNSDMLALVGRVSEDLRQRSHVVQQSNLVSVHEWMESSGPVYNTHVNIIAQQGAEEQLDILEPVSAPYFVPDVSHTFPGHKRWRMTEYIQDDLMIDIAVNPKLDCVNMAVDASAHMMDERQAEELVNRWSSFVDQTLNL